MRVGRRPFLAFLGGAVAAGTAGGEVAVLDATGAIKSLKTFGGAIADLLPGDGKLTVVTANGEIAELALPVR